MLDGNMFLGETIEFWMKLREKVENLNSNHLINDLAEAEAKVRYYEKMLDRIQDFRKGTTR